MGTLFRGTDTDGRHALSKCCQSCQQVVEIDPIGLV